MNIDCNIKITKSDVHQSCIYHLVCLKLSYPKHEDDEEEGEGFDDFDGEKFSKRELKPTDGKANSERDGQ